MRCDPGGIREASPAVLAAWQAFFTDAPGPGGVGIRTRYVRMLGRVARFFARSTAVAGFDLMNEPNAFGEDQEAALSRLYARALASVRAGERRGQGQRATSCSSSPRPCGRPPEAAPLPPSGTIATSSTRRTYTRAGSPVARSGREAFAIARTEARRFGGAPVLSGEWGADPDRAGARGDGYFLRHQALQDRFRVGATLWTWRESCGDPHKVGRSPRRAHPRGVGGVRGELPDQPCLPQPARADRGADPGIPAGFPGTAAVLPLAARVRTPGAWARVAEGRTARGLPARPHRRRDRRHGPVPALPVPNGAALPAHSHPRDCGACGCCRRPVAPTTWWPPPRVARGRSACVPGASAAVSCAH